MAERDRARLLKEAGTVGRRFWDKGKVYKGRLWMDGGMVEEMEVGEAKGLDGGLSSMHKYFGGQVLKVGVGGI